MFGVIVIIVAPACSRVVHKHRQAISLLLQLGTQSETAGFVFQVGNDVGAFPWAEGVETRGCGGEFGFFA